MKRFFLILLICQSCLGMTGAFNAFNAGEISPFLEGRTDIQKYYLSAQTIENFHILSYGGVQKRPGTQYIADARASATTARLVPFEFSVTQAYILEFSNLAIRVYANGGQIQSGGSALNITTTYLTADLFELQFAQSADTLYIVHPDYAPRTLTRTSDTAWTLATITFERGPFLAVNTTTTTITPSATTGSVTLTASVALWNSNHVTSLWQITHVVAESSVSGSFTGTGQSSSVTVQLGRQFDFSTHGTWTGTISLQKSYDSGTNYVDVITRHYENDGNIQFSNQESTDDAIYRLNMSAYTSGTLNFNLTSRAFELDGVATITAFSSSTSVTATVNNTLGGTTATANWAEGAWSSDEGYPTCVSFFEERFTVAATLNQPQRIWMSKTDDWVNFLAGTNDDASLSYTIAADQVNAIRWITSQTVLLIGTTGGEWKMAGSDFGEAITPSSVSVRRQSSYGSAYIQPVLTGAAMLFVERQGRKIRELSYDFSSDTWVSPDMTVLSEHILESGVIQIALQKTPDPTLWCLRVDGDLAVFVYNREQDVLAWSRVVFPGADVESVAVIPGSGEDEVWVLMERTVDAATVRYVEQFQPRDWGSSARDAWFVDSGLEFDGGAAVAITNITQDTTGIVNATNTFSDGQQVRISGVLGMVEANDRVYTVDSPTTSAFNLRNPADDANWDTSLYSRYTSGGTVERVENAFTVAHLNNETVTITGDAFYLGTATIEDNVITLDDYFNTVRIGLAFAAQLLPQRLEVPGQNTESLTKRITHITARLFETGDLDIGTSFTTFDQVIFSEIDDIFEGPIPLFTDDNRVTFSGSYDRTSEIFLQSRLALPCTILSIYPTFEVGN